MADADDETRQRSPDAARALDLIGSEAAKLGAALIRLGAEVAAVAAEIQKFTERPP
jgi:hypothetical protein